MQAVSWGLDSVEELERVECKEAEREASCQCKAEVAGQAAGYSSTEGLVLDGFK